MSQREQTVAVLVIGDEILSGKKEETNARFLVEQFRELGTALKGIFVIPDAFETIVHWVRQLRPAYDHLITSGGVGPTHDDRTVPAIAEALGRELHHDSDLETMIREFYLGEVNEDVLGMARLPRGAEKIHPPELRYPVIRVENILILPGEPTIFRKKFLAVREMFRSTPYHGRRLFLRADEGQIARALRDAEEGTPGVTIGSYPEFDNTEYSVMVTLESKDGAAVDAAWQRLLSALDPGWIVRQE